MTELDETILEEEIYEETVISEDILIEKILTEEIIKEKIINELDKLKNKGDITQKEYDKFIIVINNSIQERIIYEYITDSINYSKYVEKLRDWALKNKISEIEHSSILDMGTAIKKQKEDIVENYLANTITKELLDMQIDNWCDDHSVLDPIKIKLLEAITHKKIQREYDDIFYDYIMNRITTEEFIESLTLWGNNYNKTKKEIDKLISEIITKKEKKEQILQDYLFLSLTPSTSIFTNKITEWFNINNISANQRNAILLEANVRNNTKNTIVNTYLSADINKGYDIFITSLTNWFDINNITYTHNDSVLEYIEYIKGKKSELDREKAHNKFVNNDITFEEYSEIINGQVADGYLTISQATNILSSSERDKELNELEETIILFINNKILESEFKNILDNLWLNGMLTKKEHDDIFLTSIKKKENKNLLIQLEEETITPGYFVSWYKTKLTTGEITRQEYSNITMESTVMTGFSLKFILGEISYEEFDNIIKDQFNNGEITKSKWLLVIYQAKTKKEYVKNAIESLRTAFLSGDISIEELTKQYATYKIFIPSIEYATFIKNLKSEKIKQSFKDVIDDVVNGIVNSTKIDEVFYDLKEFHTPERYIDIGKSITDPFTNMNWHNWDSFTNNSVFDFFGAVKNSAMGILSGGFTIIYDGVIVPLANIATNTASAIATKLDGIFAPVESAIGKFISKADAITSSVNASINTIAENFGNDSAVLGMISKGVQIWSDGATANYDDGITETHFGRQQEQSWSKGSDSFLTTFKNRKGKTYTVNILKSTPLDPGDDFRSLYGTMMLGAPPIFNHLVDPRNRSITNTFLRDAKFLSLTPGYPKYNGSSYLLMRNEDQMHQTTTGESMIEYLLRNGLDSSFASKDKRYYTFKTDYEDYYAYLETMLNTIWIKLGLGTGSNDPSEFNIFSFFNIVNNEGGINPNNAEVLQDKYRSSLGFFVNPSSALTESFSNSPTSLGSGYASEVNSTSDTYQQINYLTGMGTGGAGRNMARKLSNSINLATNMKGYIGEALAQTIAGVKTYKTDGAIAAIFNTAAGVVKDASRFMTEVDQGAVIQSFATTNGMKTVWPELWNDSSYSRSINFNFEFTSPYGDPLSIFQYVYVPFCALLAFAMPRQAADNGMVSPFFVRADLPGYFTADLALLSDFTWTKGGDNNLWTKDGLPRSISGSFTISDLYPYLAMTKRLSFLSANPNYTVFLDNLAGLHAVYDQDNDAALNTYWKEMLQRVNGETYSTGLWNRGNRTKQIINKTLYKEEKTNKLRNIGSQIPWMNSK